MRPYTELIERLNDGAAWDNALVQFFFDIGALGVERIVEGYVTFAQGIAIEAKTQVDWQTVEVQFTSCTYRLYTRRGSELRDQEDVLQFVKVMDHLLHDHDRLRIHASRDPLTGALNRRGLEEWFEQRKRSGYGVGFILVCVDVDHFKTLNDTFGHAYGDQALVDITTALQKTLRNTDAVARLGGDEFVFVIDQTPCHCGIKSRLQEIVAGLPLGKYGLTVSMGAVCYPTHGIELEEIIALADAELYQGKADGRARVVMWGGEDCAND